MTEISAYTGKYNQFARQILQKFYTDKKDQNLVLSPFSILMLLAIAADATEGDTRTEILNVLSDDLDCDDCINLFCKLQSVLTEGHALSSANAVCVQHTIEDTITPDYPAFLQAQFSGQLFCTSDIVQAVNKWVKENTHGLIDKIADDSMKNMLACLMNATAFEGKWTKHYTRNDIEYKDFTSSDGSVRDVAMIEDTEREYVENESFREKLAIFDLGLDDRIIEIFKIFLLARYQEDHPKNSGKIELLYFFDEGKHMIQVMDGDEPAGVAELPLDFYEELKSEFAPRLPDIRKDKPFIDRQWAIETLKLGSKTNN